MSCEIDDGDNLTATAMAMATAAGRGGRKLSSGKPEKGRSNRCLFLFRNTARNLCGFRDQVYILDAGLSIGRSLLSLTSLSLLAGGQDGRKAIVVHDNNILVVQRRGVGGGVVKRGYSAHVLLFFVECLVSG